MRTDVKGFETRVQWKVVVMGVSAIVSADGPIVRRGTEVIVIVGYVGRCHVKEREAAVGGI